MDHLTEWCKDNNLVLNTSKTKEMIRDFQRTKDREPPPPPLPSTNKFGKRKVIWNHHVKTDMDQLPNFYLFVRSVTYKYTYSNTHTHKPFYIFCTDLMVLSRKKPKPITPTPRHTHTQSIQTPQAMSALIKCTP